MKKIILLIITTALLSFSCSSAKKITATKDNSGNIIGIANKETFKVNYGNDWFNDNYDSYIPSKKTVESIKPLLKNVKIKTFIGTWCGDSKREIPKLYKILDKAKFNYKNLTMIGVNRSKKANGLEKDLNIKRVPTFIFYKKGKEIGRFVEHTVNGATLEQDVFEILSEKGYKHAYQ